MTPRPDMVAIQADTTVSQLRHLFREQEYSRFPVYQENLDNILGIIRVKDLLKVDGSASDDRPITPLIRPTTFVPETKRVPELLKEFQRKQVQMAIVVDEYGGTAGLVTIEDLLEEIVGEIRDEDDVESEPIVDEGQRVLRVQREGELRRLPRAARPRGRARRVRDRRGLRPDAPGPRARRRRDLRAGRPVRGGPRSRAPAHPQGPRPQAGRRAGSRDARRLRLHHRPPERREVDPPEPHHRRKDRHRLRQAADDEDAHPRREELRRGASLAGAPAGRGGGADHVRRHARDPPAAAPDERPHGRRRRRDAARGGRRHARARRVDAPRPRRSLRVEAAEGRHDPGRARAEQDRSRREDQAAAGDRAAAPVARVHRHRSRVRRDGRRRGGRWNGCCSRRCPKGRRSIRRTT